MKNPQLNVRIREDLHTALIAMADEAHRTLKSQVEFLILREIGRAANKPRVVPVDLDPTAAGISYVTKP